MSEEDEARTAVVRYFLGLTDSEKLAYIVGLAMATDPEKLPTAVVARLLPTSRVTNVLREHS